MTCVGSRQIYISEDSQTDRQRTYNVTLKFVRESLLQWKSNKYCIFVCVHVHTCGCKGAWGCVCRACV